MPNPDDTTDNEISDPYLREMSAEKFIDDIEKASEEQASDEDE